MKKILVFCFLLIFWSWLNVSGLLANDVGWMQKGVRIWYFGGVGSTGSSDAEVAYLFSAVNGDAVQVTKHSGINHWGTANPIDTSSYSFVDKGPCWIHPQVLQNLSMGDDWMGFEITLVTRSTYTYETLPYRLLPAKALFDLKPQREIVKINYMIAGYSTGFAYFDAETGLCLFYSQLNGYVTVFFVLSEINYDFTTHLAFAEDNGPHTGFKSFVSEASLGWSFGNGGGTVVIQSSVESRYRDTVEMWVSTSVNGNITSYMPPFENYCFFGNIPVLRHMNMSEASQYPPEQWNEYGQYLWWWVPKKVLQNATINLFAVPMTRTSTNPYTFTSTQQPQGFFFSKLWFGNDGYMTAFSAKDSNTGLDIDPGQTAVYFKNLTSVDGLAYYKNTMGMATPTTFIDVPESSWAFSYISSIYNASITTGYGGTNEFKPDYEVTRDQMAAFIIRAKTGEPPSNYCDSGCYFSDVSTSGWACKYIQRLYELGITTGYGGTNQYRPELTVTREQMAVFIIRAVEGEPPSNYCDSGSPISDVPTSSWSCKYIKRLYERHITTGYGGTNQYRPELTVTRAQMAAFIGRAFLGME